MAKEFKNLVVKEYLASYKEIDNFIIVSCQGVNALDSNALRENLRAGNVAFKVVKNSLVVIVFKEMGITGLGSYINGQCAVISNSGDSVELVKLLMSCAAKYPNLKINRGCFSGREVSSEEINVLSKLPDRSVINAQIAASIRAPIVGILNGINAVLRSMLTCFSEIEKKKK